MPLEDAKIIGGELSYLGVRVCKEMLQNRNRWLGLVAELAQGEVKTTESPCRRVIGHQDQNCRHPKLAGPGEDPRCSPNQVLCSFRVEDQLFQFAKLTLTWLPQDHCGDISPDIGFLFVTLPEWLEAEENFGDNGVNRAGKTCFPSWGLVADPFQKIRKTIGSDLADGIRSFCSLYRSRRWVRVTHREHPLTQHLPPVLRLPLPTENRHQHPSQQEAHNPQNQIEPSLAHLASAPLQRLRIDSSKRFGRGVSGHGIGRRQEIVNKLGGSKSDMRVWVAEQRYHGRQSGLCSASKSAQDGQCPESALNWRWAICLLAQIPESSLCLGTQVDQGFNGAICTADLLLICEEPRRLHIPEHWVYGCIKFSLPSRGYVRGPVQKEWQCICAHVLDGSRRVLVRGIRVGRKRISIHPLAQRPAPRFRFAREKTEERHQRHQHPNHRNPNQQQVKSSLLHGPNNMVPTSTEASNKASPSPPSPPVKSMNLFELQEDIERNRCESTSQDV